MTYWLKISVLTCAFVLTGQAWAAQVVAVLDWQAALMNSKQGRQAAQTIRAELADDEAELKQLRQAIQQLQQKLQKDGAIMGDAEKRKLNREIQEKVAGYQVRMESLRKAQVEQQQAFLRSARPKLDQAVKTVIEEHKVDVLLDKQAVTFVKPEFDLTKQVIEKLNNMQ